MVDEPYLARNRLARDFAVDMPMETFAATKSIRYDSKHPDARLDPWKSGTPGSEKRGRQHRQRLKDDRDGSMKRGMNETQVVPVFSRRTLLRGLGVPMACPGSIRRYLGRENPARRNPAPVRLPAVAETVP